MNFPAKTVGRKQGRQRHCCCRMTMIVVSPISRLLIAIISFVYISGCFRYCLVAAADPHGQPQQYLSEKGRKELSDNITDILNKLVQPVRYDRRLRPNYGGAPVDVGITMYISTISAVSEVKMDYTLDIYLRQMWQDKRLGFEANVKDITIDVQYLKNIWLPDTFFPNEKKSFFHIATTHNSFLRITKDGNVTTSQRLTVKANCPMQLQLFPFDSQRCSLEIESYGYNEDHIKMYWAEGVKSVKIEPKDLASFSMADFNVQQKSVNLSSGVYSRLALTLVLERSLGFYMTQIYLPSMLVVIISWVSFWVTRESAPARVTLGVTTVLTITTLITTTNRAMPPVSYIKAVDIYLSVCYFFVFAALLEFALVSYSGKRKKDLTKRKTTKPPTILKVPPAPPPPQSSPKPDILSMETHLLTPHESSPPCTCPLPHIPSSSFHHRHHRRRNYHHHQHQNNNLSSVPSVSPRQIIDPDQIIEESLLEAQAACGGDPRQQQSRHLSLPSGGGPRGETFAFRRLPPQSASAKAMGRSLINSRRSLLRSKAANFSPATLCARYQASQVDRYSRFIFPLLFMVFNALYWSIFLIKKQNERSKPFD